MRCIVVAGILGPNKPELSASGGHDTVSQAALWVVAYTYKNLCEFLDEARLVEGAPGKELVSHSSFSDPSTRSSQIQRLDSFNKYVTIDMVEARAELLAKEGLVEGLNAEVDVWVEKFQLEGIPGLNKPATPEGKFDRFIAAWKELYGRFDGIMQRSSQRTLSNTPPTLAPSLKPPPPPASSSSTKHPASVNQTPPAPSGRRGPPEQNWFMRGPGRPPRWDREAPPLPKPREDERAVTIETVQEKLGHVTEDEKMNCRKTTCPFRELAYEEAGTDILKFDREKINSRKSDPKRDLWAFWSGEDRHQRLTWDFREFLARDFPTLPEADWETKLSEKWDVTDGGEQAEVNLLHGYDEAEIFKAVEKLKTKEPLRELCKENPLANDLQIVIRMNSNFFKGGGPSSSVSKYPERLYHYKDGTWTLPANYCVWKGAEGATDFAASKRGYHLVRRPNGPIGRLLQGLRSCSATVCKHIDGKTWYDEFVGQLSPARLFFEKERVSARKKAGLPTSRTKLRKNASKHLFRARK